MTQKNRLITFVLSYYTLFRMKIQYGLPIMCLILACNSGQKENKQDTTTKPVTKQAEAIETKANPIETKTEATEADPSIVSSDSANYNRYYNLRYAFKVDFPKLILKPERESDNGDGRIFTDKNGTISIRVYGTQDNSIAEAYKQSLSDFKAEGSKVTYRKLNFTSSVLSGFKGDTIFYHKQILTSSGVASLIIEYKKKDSTVYRQLVVRMYKSFQKINDSVHPNK